MTTSASVDLHNKYKLCDDVSVDKLEKCGFKNGTFRTTLYKNLIGLTIFVDIENNWWNYQVIDIKNDSVYTLFYTQGKKRTEWLNLLDNRLEETFDKIIGKGVFERIWDK